MHMAHVIRSHSQTFCTKKAPPGSLVVEEVIRVDTIPILNERLSVYFQNHIAQSHLAKSMTTLT